MADNIEHQDKGELVTNCDRLQNDEVVVTTPVESRIMSIREKQIMIDRDLAELYPHIAIVYKNQYGPIEVTSRPCI